MRTQDMFIALVLFLSTLAGAYAAFVPELSDDFEGIANLTERGWYVVNGEWIITPFGGDNTLYAPDFTPGSNIIYLRNDTSTYFTDSGFVMQYDWAAQNKTNFDGGDSVSISIGENFTGNPYYSVCGGYSIGLGVEVNNECIIAIDYYDTDCTYGGNLYYNTTYFNDTNQACQPNEWTAKLVQNGSTLYGYINDDLIYEGATQAFNVTQFNTVLAFASYFDQYHAQMFMDDIEVYSLDAPIPSQIVDELTDDFQDGDYTSDPTWTADSGSWATRSESGNYHVYTNTNYGAGALRSSSAGGDDFGQYEFQLDYSFRFTDIDHASLGDSYCVEIGSGYSYPHVDDGYGFCSGVSPGNNHNCSLDIEYRTGGGYGGNIISDGYALTNAGVDCENTFVNMSIRRDVSGWMEVYANGMLVHNSTRTEEESTAWDKVVILTSLFTTTGTYTVEFDDFTTYSVLQNETCVEDWVAAYENQSCNTSDLIPELLYYVDNNACGTYDDLPVDNGTVSATYPCDYCAEDIEQLFTSWGECVAPEMEESRVSYFVDNEYAACCQVTSLPSDCHVENGSYVNATEIRGCIGAYTSSDVKSVIIDGMGTAGASFVGWLDLIILMVVLGAIVAGIVSVVGRFRR